MTGQPRIDKWQQSQIQIMTNLRHLARHGLQRTDVPGKKLGGAVDNWHTEEASQHTSGHSPH